MRGGPDHPTAEQARAFLAAYADGDRDALARQFADDIVWHVGGRHDLAGDYRGREAVLAYFDEVHRRTGATLKIHPIEVLGSDHYAAIFARVTAHRHGQELAIEMAEVLARGPDGRWTEFWASSNDQDAVDRFWAE